MLYWTSIGLSLSDISTKPRVRRIVLFVWYTFVLPCFYFQPREKIGAVLRIFVILFYHCIGVLGIVCRLQY